MLPYNFDSFPELLAISQFDRTRKWFSDRLTAIAQRDRSIFDKVLMFINRFYIDVDLGEVVQLDELLPEADFVESEEIDRLVFLRTTTGQNPRVSIEPLDQQDAQRDITATSYYEWNDRLEEYCRVFDSFFPDQDMASVIQGIQQREAEIFDSLLDRTELYRLYLPREEEWTEADISEQLRRRLEEL
jgi:hypothetical protein